MRVPAALPVVLLIVTAGCLGGLAGSGPPGTTETQTQTPTPTATPTPTSTAETARPTPDPPENRTPTRVASFARRYERAAVHNAVVADVGDPAAVRLTCRSAFDRRTGAAAYALARCEGSVAASEDDTAAVGPRAPSRSVYRLGDGGAVDRAPVRGQWPVETTRRTDGTTVSPRDLYVANFGDENRTVVVTVAAVDGGGDGTALRRELRLPAGEAATLSGAVSRTGTYLVRVRVGYRTVQRHWVVDSPNGTPDEAGAVFGVYVAPDGRVTLSPAPRLGSRSG